MPYKNPRRLWTPKQKELARKREQRYLAAHPEAREAKNLKRRRINLTREKLKRERDRDHRRAKMRKKYKYPRSAAKRDASRREKARLRGHAAPPRERDCPPRPKNCECCGASIGAAALRMDHNHDTGKFMGWCCDACNTLGDNIGRLEMRITFLLERRDDRGA